MKWFLVLSSFLVAFSNAQDTCYFDATQADDLLPNCNAKFSGFPTHVSVIQKYANLQIEKSFEYLLLATRFGTYAKNRPGFEKQFRGLSDRSWDNGIDLIKHITKRGGVHNFAINSSTGTEAKSLDLDELEAMAITLDYEKELAKEAHHIHERFSHANVRESYDPEVAHYIEEKFLAEQASTIRKLAGYANDLKKLLSSSGTTTSDISFALYMFDDYLVKQ